jgi:LPXTG-motif cell wall-anchored protein
MNVALVLIGLAMTAVGGFMAWRFRQSDYINRFGPGAAMALGLFLLLTGVCTTAFGLL